MPESRVIRALRRRIKDIAAVVLIRTRYHVFGRIMSDTCIITF